MRNYNALFYEHLSKLGPDAALVCFGNSLGPLDSVIVLLLIVFAYFAGATCRHHTGFILSYIVLQQICKSKIPLYIHDEGLSIIVEWIQQFCTNEIIILASAIIVGIFISKTAPAIIICSAASFYIFTMKTFENHFSTSQYLIVTFMGILLPLVVMCYAYAHIDVLLTMLLNSLLSTFFALWCLEKNFEIFGEGRTTITRDLVKHLVTFQFFTIDVFVFIIFVGLSMISQIILMEPVEKVYYVIKERVIRQHVPSFVHIKKMGNKVSMQDNDIKTEYETYN